MTTSVFSGAIILETEMMEKKRHKNGPLAENRKN